MIISEITKELNQNIDCAYKEGATKFFKEEVKIYGVRIPIVRAIARKYFQKIKNWEKKKIFSLCEKLLKKDYDVYRTIAFDWIYKIKQKFVKKDYDLFEGWVKKYVTNWAACDDFCTHSFGYLVTENPELLPKLRTMAKSKNLWERRAAAVTLIHPVKRKKHLDKVFEMAKILLKDEEDMVRKGYGWMLKEAANHYQKEVFNFVMKNKKEMPRTALRYAIEKMPVSLKKKAMSKN